MHLQRGNQLVTDTSGRESGTSTGRRHGTGKAEIRSNSSQMDLTPSIAVMILKRPPHEIKASGGAERRGARGDAPAPAVALEVLSIAAIALPVLQTCGTQPARTPLAV
jgi:hypothetical protein